MLKQMVKAILPEALKPVAREVRAFFKGQDLLKYPYPRNLIIDNSEASSANRAYVREILHTKYNENYDKIMHDYFINNTSNAIHKWYMYFDAYERTFSRFRGKNVNILEIGVQNGGSARMWRDYFTHDLPNARVKIFGIDINPKCKDFADENIEIFIGDAENRSFWRDLKGKIPKIDILIDDGGHTMRQQIVAFEEMFPHIADNGVYFIEDLHTSYWRQMGGGIRIKNHLSNTPKI